MQNNYEHIPQEKFAFAQLDKELHDQKFDTKSRSYMQDAFLRFKKNKSSVFAAWIILFLVFFALVAPIISPYEVADMMDNDKVYMNTPPFVEWFADKGWGILDGSIKYSTNQLALDKLKAIALETGMDPVIEMYEPIGSEVREKGQLVTKYTYPLSVNK